MYIGHDKGTIDHLNEINICHTYWVKTEGMTEKDMKAIHEKYFEGWIQENENENENEN